VSRTAATRQSTSIATVFAVSLLVATQGLLADDFVIEESPTQAFGNRGEEAFKEPEDPKVCLTYLRNLQYLARLNTPLSCERPIARQFKPMIQLVEWENLDPIRYPDLFRAVLAEFHYWKTNPPKDEEKALAWSAEKIREKEIVFRRAMAKLRGTPDSPLGQRTHDAQYLWYVQYGLNTTDSANALWRCEPRRGGPTRDYSSSLRLYLVSEDMTTVFQHVVNPHNGNTGEALRLINGRLYVERIDSRGDVFLLEPDSESPGWLDYVCMFRFSRRQK